jgi:serine/threonine protein phosphatase 1
MVMSRVIQEASFERIVVVGDLHGYRDPLLRLLEKISLGDGDLVVFIGDYVDRGPDSKVLVDTLIEFAADHEHTVFLKGNHEDMLLGAIGMPAVIQDIRTWFHNGGVQTLASYGAEEGEIFALPGVWDPDERNARTRSLLPESHVVFFSNLELYVETENYFICHAGVSPFTGIEEGKKNIFDLLWTRDHLYADAPEWEKTVVCGHTPQREVLVREKLICIDTGLYYYGKLSAIDLLSGKIFQVRRDAKE